MKFPAFYTVGGTNRETEDGLTLIFSLANGVIALCLGISAIGKIFLPSVRFLNALADFLSNDFLDTEIVQRIGLLKRILSVLLKSNALISSKR